MRNVVQLQLCPLKSGRLIVNAATGEVHGRTLVPDQWPALA